MPCHSKAASIAWVQDDSLLRQRIGPLDRQRIICRPSLPNQKKIPVGKPGMTRSAGGIQRQRSLQQNAPLRETPPHPRSRLQGWRAASNHTPSDRLAAETRPRCPSHTTNSGAICAAVSEAIWSCRFSTSGIRLSNRRPQLISPDTTHVNQPQQNPNFVALFAKAAINQKIQVKLLPAFGLPVWLIGQRGDRCRRDADDRAEAGKRSGDLLGQPQGKRTVGIRSDRSKRHDAQPDRVRRAAKSAPGLASSDSLNVDFGRPEQRRTYARIRQKLFRFGRKRITCKDGAHHAYEIGRLIGFQQEFESFCRRLVRPSPGRT